jgi:hypothetical protein
MLTERLKGRSSLIPRRLELVARKQVRYGRFAGRDDYRDVDREFDS